MYLESHNFHWRDGFAYNYPKKRDIFYELEKALSGKRIITLTGTRRTGKTTIMRQLIDTLIERSIPRTNIMYYSFDEEQPSIRDIIKEYEKKINRELAFSNERYYLFLDEIQKLNDWQNKVKYFYDQYKNLKIILTGSASLFILSGVRESLAGRIKEFFLGPLSFKEYLSFRDNIDLLEKPDLFVDTLETQFEKYLLRQYIEIIQEDELEIKDYMKSILEKVVYIDIPNIFKIENPNVLMKIMRIISENPGLLLDYSNMAQTLSNESPINRGTISKYVHYLEEAYLLRLGYNYSGSNYVSERKLKKAYLSNPSMSVISNSPCSLGHIVEQSFFINLDSRFFWRTPQKDEVDIILENGDTPIPIEVKYQNRINRSDEKGLKKFMKKKKITTAFIITKNMEDTRHTPEGRIHLVPAWKAALQGRTLFFDQI